MTLVFTIAWCALHAQRSKHAEILLELRMHVFHIQRVRAVHNLPCRACRPLLTIPAGVFSLGYFYFFVILSIIWGAVRVATPPPTCFLHHHGCSLAGYMTGSLPAWHSNEQASTAFWPGDIPNLQAFTTLTRMPAGLLRAPALCALHAQVCAIIAIFLPLWESRDVFARVVGLGGPAPGNATLPKAARSEIQLKTAGDDYAHEGVHTASGDGMKL
jgi:hypothetical protein